MEAYTWYNFKNKLSDNKYLQREKKKGNEYWGLNMDGTRG